MTLDKQGASNPNQAKLEIQEQIEKSKSVPLPAGSPQAKKGLSIDTAEKSESNEVPIIRPRSPKKKSVNLKYL